jgi:alpha-beta hydrolase superfamily lysophospholipase
MPYFDGVDGRVYYRRWTAEHPRAKVLLLHGFGEHTGHYHRLGHALADAGFDVWALDHIGHGLSAGRRGLFDSVEDLADNAAELLDMLAGTPPEAPVVVVGHSLGAITAALIVSRGEPTVAGLVMTGAPLHGLPAEAAGRDDLIMSRDETYLDALANDPLGFDTAPCEANLWRALSTAGATVRERLPHWDGPVLLINGEHDVFAAPSAAATFAECLPNGRSVVIGGGFHDIPNDVAHRRVAAVVVESIDRWCA